MKHLDTLEVRSKSGSHFIELYQGDLTDMPDEHAVDVLVVSAFPGSYSIFGKNTLMGALGRIGVDVRDLAKDKAADLRETFSCWLTKDLDTSQPGVQFKRILVFEPLIRGEPYEVVGDIFQSLMPFVSTEPYITSIAMPIVASGNQGIAPVQMLIPLIEASINWFKLGLPVKTLKIVEVSSTKAMELKGAFAVLKHYYHTQEQNNRRQQFEYDYFISYSHDDIEQVSFLYDELHRINPDVRVFMDRQNLKAGSAWQQELYETIDRCAQIITVYSPTYLASKVCREEYNIALMRHREEGDILVPLYLYSASLPTYMKLIQYLDCREADYDKITASCASMLQA